MSVEDVKVQHATVANISDLFDHLISVMQARLAAGAAKVR